MLWKFMFILALVSYVDCGLFDLFDNIKKKVDEMLNLGPSKHLSEKKVEFHLVSINVVSRKVLDLEQPSELGDCHGNIYFLIHDWWSGIDWYSYMTENLLDYDKRGCVILVDWEPIRDNGRTENILAVELSGNRINQLLSKASDSFNMKGKQIILLGYGMGAHIAGVVGRLFAETRNTKIKRIVAMDPIEPMLLKNHGDNKVLTKKDAEYVHVVHTAAGSIGASNPIGTIDFYPNGGAFQPGCPKLMASSLPSAPTKAELCANKRSLAYTIEAISNPGGFKASKCHNWIAYQAHKCPDGEEVSLGDLNTTATGIFYLETRSKMPFALNKSLAIEAEHSNRINWETTTEVASEEISEEICHEVEEEINPHLVDDAYVMLESEKIFKERLDRIETDQDDTITFEEGKSGLMPRAIEDSEEAAPPDVPTEKPSVDTKEKKGFISKIGSYLWAKPEKEESEEDDMSQAAAKLL